MATVEKCWATSLHLDRGEPAILLRDEKDALLAERERAAGRIRPHLLVRADVDGVGVTRRAEEEEIVRGDVGVHELRPVGWHPQPEERAVALVMRLELTAVGDVQGAMGDRDVPREV